MPLTARSSARRRRKNPDEKLPERPGESTSSAQVMAPTRMKLRVRRRDNAAGGAGAAAGGGQPEEEDERSGGRSSRRKNTSSTSTTAAAAAAATASSPPSSSASASARAVMAAQEASPDSKCPICLDRFNNLAYLDRCLHRFCFPCIQEWSHNKAECPLCKQPFASILHSVRAEDDFKEYTLQTPPANSSVATTMAMVAAMASAARSNHQMQMRVMLGRHRGADGGETTTRRRRRERGGRGGGGRWGGERTVRRVWFFGSRPLALPPPLPQHPEASPVVAEDSEEAEEEEQRMMGGADLAERGVIFEGLTGLGTAEAPVARASRRLMTRLAARKRLQQEGGTVRRLRERETVAFRRALYRSGIQVRGVAGVTGGCSQGQQQQQDITAESFRRNPSHLNRLRPWLRRELTVLYGAHGSLVDIVQRIIMARLARHGLEDTPTIEEELRPFLLARTDHFLHELVSFARSPLSLETYDQQAVYDPPAPATHLELDGTSSSSDSSSVIAISEGEEEERRPGGRSEEALLEGVGGAHDDVIQAGSSLSLSAWDDETPGPSYSTAEPSCSLAALSFSLAAQEPANEKREERREGEEEECLIVGYKKPIAERTPELVQLSSDTEEEEKKKEEEEEVKSTAEKLPPLPTTTPPLSYLPTIPPSTSGVYRDEQDDKPREKDGEPGGRRSRARSWSDSSGRSRNSVCTLSPTTPGESERQRESWRDGKQDGSEAAREKRRRKRSHRRRERSGDRLRKSGILYNPNRSIYPAMMRHRSPSPFHSSVESGSPSPPDSSWDYHCSQVSPLTSSVSSPSRSSSFSSSPPSSPQASSQTPPTPSLSPSDRGNTHHGEKPGGKRKYKSRHLDSDNKDPTWRPSSSSQRREKRKERRRRRGREGGRRRERQRRDARRESGGDSSSRRCREDRSPSVEIIYEGTITSSATQPPARKRRRKRHRKTQHSSSPVIITLDSDSSNIDVNNKNDSGSSSPLSSQQTVDFSDLPPLPLVHSVGVGGVLNAEIGELPVDILDRGSDGSEPQAPGRPEAAGPIAINSDNSEHDVDVENVEESGSLLGSDDDKGPIREVDTTAANQREVGAGDAAPTTTNLVGKRYLGGRMVLFSDLKRIAASKCDPSLNVDPNSSPDTRRKHIRDQGEVGPARSNQDDWLTQTRHPNPNHDVRQFNSVTDHILSLDLPTCHTSLPAPPPLERLKECRDGEEGRDVPPLLKQASPVRSYNRNTPPPLKHKDAGSPHLLPLSPIDLHTPQASADADPGESQAIPPISTLKRHFTSALASTSSTSAIEMHSSCHSAASDSHSPASSQVRPLTIGIHSKPPSDSHPSSGSDYKSHLDLNSFHSPKSHSSTMETSSGRRSPPIDLHPVNSLPNIDFHPAKTGCSKDKPAHTDSTSRGRRNKTPSPDSCRVAPVDLHPSSSVAAEGTPAGRDVFSRANCNNTSPPVYVSSIHPVTPSSPIDSHSSSKRENIRERLSPPTLDVHPQSPEPTVDLHSLSAASDEQALSVNHDQRLPDAHLPSIDSHCSSPVPPANEHSSGFVGATIDEHLNHSALSSTAFQTSHKKCSSLSEPTVEPHSKLTHVTDSGSNHFDPSSNPQFPIDNCSKHKIPVDSQPPTDSRSKNSRRDFQLPTDNHITSSPQSIENQ